MSMMKRRKVGENQVQLVATTDTPQMQEQIHIQTAAHPAMFYSQDSVQEKA
jgi:hypothetical protein